MAMWIHYASWEALIFLTTVRRTILHYCPMQMQLDAYKEIELSQLEINLHHQKQAIEDLDAALVANLICALDEVDMETELKICIDENCVLKRDLDVVLIAKMEADECHTKEKQELCGIINDKGMMVDKLQQRIVSIHEVKNRYYEIKADRYTLIAEKEIAISDIQQTVESVSLLQEKHQEESPWYSVDRSDRFPIVEHEKYVRIGNRDPIIDAADLYAKISGWMEPYLIGDFSLVPSGYGSREERTEEASDSVAAVHAGKQQHLVAETPVQTEDPDHFFSGGGWCF
ncbi:hypothetical protein ACJX0J_023416 [Zea mays]